MLATHVMHLDGRGKRLYEEMHFLPAAAPAGCAVRTVMVRDGMFLFAAYATTQADSGIIQLKTGS